jgi:CMP-N-acetylneuraminic acid synthetase
MDNSISVFLPTRKGSERVANKNTRDFCGINGGLLYLKLQNILKLKNVKEIILSTNDPASIEVGSRFKDSRLRIVERPEHLCLSETKVSDLIAYVPTCVSSDHILWLHVTTPFVGVEDYNQAIEQYFRNLNNNSFDSLLSVNKLQQFLWDNESRRMINFDIEGGNWPRTQDLKPLYEVNHAFYINSKSNYVKYNNRVSPNLDIFVLGAIKSLDVDLEDDFLIAEAIYDRLYKV